MEKHIGHLLPSTLKTAGLITSVENISESLKIYNFYSSIYSFDNYPKFLKQDFL